MKSIYDIIGDNFFAPLASKNRRIYLDSILYLHTLINSLFEDEQNEKDIIVAKLAEKLDDMVTIKIYDELTDEEVNNTSDNTNKARFIINTLLNCNWLIEESIGSGKRTVDLSSFAYSFIDVILEIAQTRQISYTGYIRNISDILSRFKYSSVDDLISLNNEVNTFIVSLRALRASINSYYKHIAENKSNDDLETLLGEFTGEYRVLFFDSAYFRLKVYENVDLEIPRIIQKFERIFDDFTGVDKLINAAIDEDYEDYDAASNYIYSIRKQIMANLQQITQLMQMIDTKNEKYVNRAVKTIIYLINRGQDIEGIINRLISYISNTNESINLLNLFEIKHFGFAFLSKPRIKYQKAIPEMLPLDSDISEETKKKTLDILQEDVKYSLKEINRFVTRFLGDLKERKISELELNSKYDFVMMISIMMYSKSPEASFEVEATTSRIVKNGIAFNDFIVKKRDRNDKRR